MRTEKLLLAHLNNSIITMGLLKNSTDLERVAATHSKAVEFLSKPIVNVKVTSRQPELSGRLCYTFAEPNPAEWRDVRRGKRAKPGDWDACSMRHAMTPECMWQQTWPMLAEETGRE